MKALRPLLLASTTLGLAGCATLPELLYLPDDLPAIPKASGPALVISPQYVHASAGQTVSFQGRTAAGAETRWRLVTRPAGSQASLKATARGSNLNVDQPGEYVLEAVASLGGQDSAPARAYLRTDAAVPAVRFVALGDMGTGAEGQYRVARAMASVCKTEGCDFALGTGDNIYPSGPNDVKDVQFEDKFEKPYAILPFAFYMSLGNHDNTGINAGDGSLNRRGEVELAYSRRKDRSSPRWQMPHRYYSFGAPIADTARQPMVEFLAINSNTLNSLHDSSPKYDLKTDQERQGRWADAVLKSSPASWRIAYGHHPYVSNGQHGNAGNYDDARQYADGYLVRRASGVYFRDFVRDHLCGTVDLYISGHDHTLQWLEPRPECGNTEFLVTGAGAKSEELVNRDKNPFRWQAGSEGFFWVEATPTVLTVRAYTVSGPADAPQVTLAYENWLLKN